MDENKCIKESKQTFLVEPQFCEGSHPSTRKAIKALFWFGVGMLAQIEYSQIDAQFPKGDDGSSSGSFSLCPIISDDPIKYLCKRYVKSSKYDQNSRKAESCQERAFFTITESTNIHLSQ